MQDRTISLTMIKHLKESPTAKTFRSSLCRLLSSSRPQHQPETPGRHWLSRIDVTSSNDQLPAIRAPYAAELHAVYGFAAGASGLALLVTCSNCICTLLLKYDKREHTRSLPQMA